MTFSLAGFKDMTSGNQEQMGYFSVYLARGFCLFVVFGFGFVFGVFLLYRFGCFFGIFFLKRELSGVRF